MTQSLKYTLFIAVCIALVLIVAMRGETRDTQNYLELYRSLSEFPWDPAEFQVQFKMEWGIGILTSLVKLLSLPPEVLFLIVSALTFFAIARASLAIGLDAWSAIPFYLCTFFLTHQFMQIRQGLAVALALWSISILIRSPKRWLAVCAITLVGALFHVVSLVPVLVAFVGLRFTPQQRSYKNWFWVLITFILIIGLCRVITWIEVFTLTARISTYISDDEAGASRSVFDLANLRAIIMTLAFVALRPRQDRPYFHAYMVLLGLYVAHLAIRMGFIDFAILSGRIGSSLGFAEIFLLPLVLRDRVRRHLWKFMFIGAYAILHFTVSLYVQLPFLIEDYFRPI